MSLSAYPVNMDSMAARTGNDPNGSDLSELNGKRKNDRALLETAQSKRIRVDHADESSSRADEVNDFLDFIDKLRNDTTKLSKTDQTKIPKHGPFEKKNFQEGSPGGEQRKQGLLSDSKSKKSSELSSNRPPQQSPKESSNQFSKESSNQFSNESSQQASTDEENTVDRIKQEIFKNASNPESAQFSGKQTDPPNKAHLDRAIQEEAALTMLQNSIAGLAGSNQEVTSRDLQELQLKHELQQRLLAQQLQGADANQGNRALQELSALSALQNEQNDIVNYLSLLGGDAAALGSAGLNFASEVDNAMLQAMAARNGFTDAELLRLSTLTSRIDDSGLQQYSNQLSRLSGLGGRGLVTNDMIANNDPLVSALMQEKLLRMGELPSGLVPSFSSIPHDLRHCDASTLSALSALAGPTTGSGVNPDLDAVLLRYGM